jgi:hypothetical protein
MSSRPNLPNEPVGIERLIELLNESEEPPERHEQSMRVQEDAQAEPTRAIEAELACEDAAKIIREFSESEALEELGDVVQNRFAAHVVLGLSKSKTAE